MGFFDSLVKGVAQAASSVNDGIKSAALDSYEKNWNAMDSMSGERLLDIFKERGVDSPMGILALMHLVRNGTYINLNSSQKEEAKSRAQTIKRSIEMAEGRTFDDIRDAIEMLLRRL